MEQKNITEKNLKSTAFTRTKNLYEAIRNNVNGKYSPEYDFAKCGCCNCEPVYPVIRKNDDIVWSQESYKFLEFEYSPDSSYDINGNLRIHPTLWNNGTNNLLSGVFEVLPNKIYQVRGYDMANITFVKTVPDENLNNDSRWIVMDTLMSNECTKEAVSLFENFLGTKLGSDNYTINGKIIGMIISHSHIDHYGGMQTISDNFVTDEEILDSLNKNDSNVPHINYPFILAPEGFFEHSVSENIYVGNAMGRRASYQYGSFIKPDPSTKNIDSYTSGSISIGIGQGQSTGTTSLLKPTLELGQSFSELKLDGLSVQFQLTPGTEAPAEMNNYFPDYNALWLAENCTGTLHNLYTLRGAEVRDGKAWAKYLMEAAYLYGDKTDVIFQSHNWPHWDEKADIKASSFVIPRVDIKQFIIETAAIYKYINDQTMLYMNMGYKMNEASDMLTLPRAMQKNWCLKPFYGTPKHNAKAVYQKYLGWYDANPIHLEEMPPEQFAQELLRYTKCGSEENMLDYIRKDHENGNYWTAAYMSNQLILGSKSPDTIDEAKTLCANALQQLGYQSESGTWRNAYLAAAYELFNEKGRTTTTNPDIFGSLTVEMLLDYLAIFFDGDRGASKLSFDGYLCVNNGDATEKYMFAIKNGAILYYRIDDNTELPSDKTISLSRNDIMAIIGSQYSGNVKILQQLSKCVVNVKKDRFKYFDIIGKHDSEVKIEKDDHMYDLVKNTNDCIALLEPYVGKLNDETKTFPLSAYDKKAWADYLNILKNETHVTLDGEFFDPDNPNVGIGADGEFFEYELHYTLYSLYHYLYSGYLKNDYGFNHLNYDEESFIKLKKKIVLLENYVADFYLCAKDHKVAMDENDSNAYRYLTNTSGSDLISFTVAEFFLELYLSYKEMASELNRTECEFCITGNDSDTSISVYNKNNYHLKCNGKEVSINADGSANIDISGESGNVVIEAYVPCNNNSGISFVMGRMIYHNP